MSNEKENNKLNYSEKFSLLNQEMRWQAADILRELNWETANRKHKKVVSRSGFYVKYGKRVIDIIISFVALVVSAPINLMLLLLIYFDLGKPVLFKQNRVGLNGEEFEIVKLRTMRDAVDENGKPLLGELRVTKLGRVIRRSSLDELLNFWSIFKGDMSIIGPRPLPPEYLSRYTERHSQRHEVKPGLECPIWKEMDRAPTYEDQLENDIWYAQNVSFLTDLILMFKVFKNVFDRRQNSVRGNSSRGIFMGYDTDGKVITSKEIPDHILDTVLKLHGMDPNKHDARKP